MDDTPRPSPVPVSHPMRVDAAGFRWPRRAHGVSDDACSRCQTRPWWYVVHVQDTTEFLCRRCYAAPSVPTHAQSRLCG
jgi:hypothetical protein